MDGLAPSLKPEPTSRHAQMIVTYTIPEGSSYGYLYYNMPLNPA